MSSSVRSMPRRLWCAAASALALVLPSTPTRAEDFPSKSITIVVPYPPGSATDLVARLLGPKIAESTKQAVIVENRGGASTNIGTSYVARAAADGYTVLIQVPNIATNEFMFNKLAWKRSDFTPVVLLVRWSNVLLAGPSAQERDFTKLVAASKAKSGGLDYGSPGVGSLAQLAVEMLKGRTGLDIRHVSYTGPGPMITGLLGGQIGYGATNPATFMSYVREGKFKLTPMVVLGSQRDPTIPYVPSLADFGITGIDSYGWLGALVPSGTPAPVVARLNAEFMKALKAPDVQERLKAVHLESLGSTPEAFGEFIAAENAKWGKSISEAGIARE